MIEKKLVLQKNFFRLDMPKKKKKCVRAFYELSPINGLTFPPD